MFLLINEKKKSHFYGQPIYYKAEHPVYETYANSEDNDQMLSNAVSNQVLNCLLIKSSIKI